MWLLLSLLLVGGQGLSPRTLQSEIQKLIEEPTFQDAFWGVSVYAPLRASYLFEHNSHRNFKPASNQKILTTLLAFEYLGPEYQFQTTVGHTGSLEDGIIKGDMVVVGGGDPSFSGRYTQHFTSADLIALLSQQISARGIKAVHGNLIADLSFFDDRPIHNSWEWGDIGTYYGVPVTALSLNDGLYDVRMEVDSHCVPAWQVWPEDLTNFSIEDRLVANGGQRFRFKRHMGTDHFTAWGGTKPCERHAFAVAALRPGLHFLESLREALAREGIQVSGRLYVSNQPVPDVKPVAIWLSDPLAITAKVMMKASQNHYADAFLKTTAREVMGAGSFEAGSSLAREFLGSLGAGGARGHQMRDGSGLSVQNSITPGQLIDVLRFGLNAPYRDTWLATLSVMGSDGTLKERGSQPIRRRVWAKSGYINRVRTLSGYMETAKGEPLIFSLMANNYSCSVAQVEVAQDRILHLLRQLKLQHRLHKSHRLFELTHLLERNRDGYPLDGE